MNLQMKKLLLIAITGITACSSSGLNVYYDSVPQSAKLICGGQFVGYTPRRLNYTIHEGHIQRGYVQTQPCEAVWMGGAKESYRNQFPVNYSSHSYNLTAVSNNVQTIDIQFDAQREASFQAQQQRNDQIINSIGQNLPKRTYCNNIAGTVMCNTY